MDHIDTHGRTTSYGELLKSYQYIVVCDIRLTKHELHAVASVFALAPDAQEQTGREV